MRIRSKQLEGCFHYDQKKNLMQYSDKRLHYPSYCWSQSSPSLSQNKNLVGSVADTSDVDGLGDLLTWLTVAKLMLLCIFISSNKAPLVLQFLVRSPVLPSQTTIRPKRSNTLWSLIWTRPSLHGVCFRPLSLRAFFVVLLSFFECVVILLWSGRAGGVLCSVGP